eukprot:m.235962 g.235962  ORF g.235962 m.235962 type:complete len:1784 (+) comp40130_c0_seq16:813-6164(+)
MNLQLVLSFAFVLSLSVRCSLGSHFRGAIITWKPDADVPSKVVFSFKIAWRRGTAFCDDDTISSNTLIGESGAWACQSGCSGSVGSTQFFCTGFSKTEDWTQGENTFEYTFSGSGPFVISYTGSAWIGGLVSGGGSWAVPTTVDLSVRTDTGKINSSPISATAPIIRLQKGCSYSLLIHTDDPDGDTVKCRWATSTGPVNECGGVCGTLINEAVLDENPCTLNYNPASTGWHAVALMLEDFPDPTVSANPLSSVPLQFLLRVTDNGGSCERDLRYAASTLTNNDCRTVEPGKSFSVQVAVVENTARLREIFFVAPRGISKTGILGTYPNRYVEASWTPRQDQYGSHVFCFSAIDNFGNALEQRCITILAGVRSPKLVLKTERPLNGSVKVDGFTRVFSVNFDQEIRRPTKSKFIRVNAINGSTVATLAALDTSSSSSVLIKNRTLTFFLPSAGILIPDTAHFVSMDHGAVVGLQACASSGSPFEGIQDQTTWSFTTEPVKEHPCEIDGKGPCQRYCDFLGGSSYECLCNNDELLAPNQHTCYPKNKPPVCTGDCSGNGVCIGNELCDCRVDWKGNTCSDPVCYGVADCSRHGDCVSPDVCMCNAGWEGRACSVDLCSIHRSCSTCTASVGCGWCDSSRRCIPGSGFGPDDAPSSCLSWFYYNCLAAANTPTTGCFLGVDRIDCSVPCINANLPSTKGPGSLQYCRDVGKACKDFAVCFSAPSEGCLSWNEAACPVGRPLLSNVSPSRRRRESENSGEFNSVVYHGQQRIDILASRAIRQAVVEETVKAIEVTKIFASDHGLLRKIAWVESKYGRNSVTFRDPNSDAAIGIWQMDKVTFDGLRSPRSGSMLEGKYKKIKKVFGIDMEKQTREDLYKPLISALFARALLFTKTEAIPKDDESQANFWRNQYTPGSKGTVQQFSDDIASIPIQLKTKDESCVQGFRGSDGICVCKENYIGEKCDRPKCPGSPLPCSNNGVCIEATDGSGNHRCQCRGRWQGVSCERLPPAPTFGDPHLRTIDGLDFDYFDIGVYWGCMSRENDFEVQLAFFKYQGTSLVGGVALKVGDGVLTLVSENNSSVLSLLRINGTKTEVAPGDVLELSQGDVTLYVTNDTGFVLYFVQYRNGITYSIETHYSSTLERQYLNVALGATAALFQKTSGLCGFTDGDTNNDMTGPDGTRYDNAIEFGDSWRVELSDGTPFPESAEGVVWSWNASNFYPSDIAGEEYNDPGHAPRYDSSDFSSEEIQNAQTICEAKGLSGTFLDSCKLDIVFTGDSSFADQSAFQIGNCPNDCSNHGTCVNNSCICSGLWTGNDCSQGGCSDCGPNSECKNGFCVCKFGYQKRDNVCTQVSCEAVNNCTSSLQGVCSADNECLCSPGFTGPDCSQVSICTVSCSGHGVCGLGNQCICDPNWSGVDCSIPDCSELQNCSGHGVCNTNASCDCQSGWTGSSCSSPSCNNVNDCSGNGLCTSPGQCTCNQGFAPPDCSSPVTCPSLSNCSGNGICLTPSSCLCYDSFAGSSCEFPLCLSGCSNQGRCVGANFCECNQGWTGLSCSEPSCESNRFCSGNGECAEFDRCVCRTNWTGPDCNVPHCVAPNELIQCSGRGTCIRPGVCSCKAGYAGNFCQDTVDVECSNSWPVQRDRWINEYKEWINATETCLGIKVNVTELKLEFDSMSPTQQWIAIRKHFVTGIGVWQTFVAPLITDLPASFSVDESESLDEQWNSINEFMNQMSDIWYGHVGDRFGFTRSPTPSRECKDRQTNVWNEYLSREKFAREKYGEVSNGDCVP